ENSKLIEAICTRFTLNEEQQRAFRIVADHASSGSPAPLKLYIGGMGGSGKSQVFKAITTFFDERKESYRYMVVAPTGATAALLKGSTYHSVFKIARESKSKNRDDIDGIRDESKSMAGINERLQGVEYILLDEISMVSCSELQTLSSQ
ncbi:DNA helicase Pif1 like protein, partial [Mycena crocata]